ncbi:hypothetical protein D3C87_2071360 [compost metagenome]
MLGHSLRKANALLCRPYTLFRKGYISKQSNHLPNDAIFLCAVIEYLIINKLKAIHVTV